MVTTTEQQCVGNMVKNERAKMVIDDWKLTPLVGCMFTCTPYIKQFETIAMSCSLLLTIFLYYQEFFYRKMLDFSIFLQENAGFEELFLQENAGF